MRGRTGEPKIEASAGSAFSLLRSGLGGRLAVASCLIVGVALLMLAVL